MFNKSLAKFFLDHKFKVSVLAFATGLVLLLNGISQIWTGTTCPWFSDCSSWWSCSGEDSPCIHVDEESMKFWMKALITIIWGFFFLTLSIINKATEAKGFRKE